MTCQRCRGLMTGDAFIDMIDDSGHVWLGAWRCVNCGHILDAGSTKNQERQRTGLLPVLRRRNVRRAIPRAIEWNVA